MPKLSRKKGAKVLSVADIVERAHVEFGFVHVDGKRGMNFVAQRLLSSGSSVRQETADRLLDPLGGSIEMIVGDDRQSDVDFLKCFVIPNEPIEIEYVFDGHETYCAPLIFRLACILNYESLGT